jgi:hypothetical protein
MFGLAAAAAMGIGYLVVKALDRKSQYKPPKGKHKNRYK